MRTKHYKKASLYAIAGLFLIFLIQSIKEPSKIIGSPSTLLDRETPGPKSKDDIIKPAKHSPRLTPREVSSKIDPQSLVRKWDSTSDLSGTNRIAAQTKVLNEAINRLTGKDMIVFIDHITHSGYPTTFDSYIAASISNIFRCPDESTATDWFGNLTNSGTQARLAYSVGLSHSGKDIESLLLKINSPKSKQELLVGFCSKYSYDPLLALNNYIHLSGKDFSDDSLARVAGSANSKFEESLKTIENLESTIDLTKTKTAFLKKWSRLDPLAANQYIVENSSVYSPSYLSSTIQGWFSSSPNNAQEWIKSIPDQKYRDFGTELLVSHWKLIDPKRAWDTARDISNETVQARLMDEVYREWSKIDPDGAKTAARDSDSN